MTKGRITAKELKHDPLMDQYLTTRSWIQARSRPLLLGLTVAAVIGAAILIFWLVTSRRERGAAESLSEAFKVAEAIVANPVPPNTPGYAFTSEDEKNRKAFEAFDKAARDYPSVHGDLARFSGAMFQIKFDAQKAEVTLKELAAKNSAISPQAKLALAERYEASGRLDEAIAAYNELKTKPGDISPLLINFSIARVYEAQGKNKEAADMYFSVAKDSKSVGIGTVALTRLSTLDPSRLTELPPPEPSSPLAGFR